VCQIYRPIKLLIGIAAILILNIGVGVKCVKAIILMIIITSVGISMSIKLIVNRTIDYKNKLSENL